jgi:hypothetical protein
MVDYCWLLSLRLGTAVFALVVIHVALGGNGLMREQPITTEG